MPLDDAAVMNGLLGKIYKIMAAPDDIVPGAATRGSTFPYVCFASPGIAIDSVDFGEMTTRGQINACADFSDLVNAIPASAGVWRRTAKRVQDIYRLAITDVELAPDKLSGDEQEMLKRAERFLREETAFVDPFTGEKKVEMRPTAALKAYESMFTAYSAALRRYNSVKNTALSNPTPESVADWRDNGPLYEEEVRIAYERWGSLGYRDYVHQANSIIAQLTGRGSYAQYERLRQNFRLAEKKDFRGQSFYPTFANPPGILSGAFDDAWTTFSFSHSEAQTYESFSRTSWGGGFSAGWGLWSAGGSYSRTDEQRYFKSNASGISVSCRLIQVPIIRGWCEPWIFSSKAWKGRNALAQPGSVSDGTPAPAGLMPMIPTSLILAKNVRMGMDMSSIENRSALTQISSSFSGGWGPFSVRGNYSSTSASSSSNVSADASGIEFKGAQVIGFICDLLPKSPDPDPVLFPAPLADPRAFHRAADAPLNEEAASRGRGPALMDAKALRWLNGR